MLEHLSRGVYRKWTSIPQSPAPWREQSSIYTWFSPALFREYMYLHILLGDLKML